MSTQLGTLVVDLVADATRYKSGLADTENATKGWAGRISGVAQNALKVGMVGAAAALTASLGAVGVAAFQVSTQTQQAAADMAAGLGLPIDAANEFAEVARQVYGNNFTDSVRTAGEAVAEVARQFELAADNPALQRITEQAISLEDTFGTGVTESVAAARQLMQDFGLTSDQAFDFITAGYQRGLDSSGDFLDSVTEYSTQFANGGADAGQFFSVLETGMQAGMLGTDKAADAFKEFRLRIIDGSSSTAGALDLIGLSADEMTAAIDSGSMTAADAFVLVTQKLSETESASVRMQAGAGLLGTQFEDLGDTAVAALSMTSVQMADLAGSTDALDNKYATFSDRAAGMWRKITVAVSPLTDEVLRLAEEAMPSVEAGIQAATPLIISMAAGIGPLVERVTGWIEKWNQLDERTKRIITVVGAVVAAIGPVLAVLGPLITVISTVITVAGAVAPVLGVIGVALTALTGPIGLIILAVVALVAAWKTDFLGLRTHTLNILGALKTGFSGMVTAVRGNWTQLGPWLASTTRSSMQQVQSAWDSVMQRLPQGVRTQMTAITGIFRTGFSAHRQIVMASLQFMRGDFRGGMELLRGAAQSGLDMIGQVFQWQVQNIQNIFKYQNWMGLGWDIVQGVARGIQNGAGAIISAARQAAYDALRAAMAALGINSPSTVAAEMVGEPFAEGIGVGIDRGMGDLTRNIGFGLDGMVGSVAPTSTGSAGVGSINVTQYFGEGADRAAVAAGAQDGLLAGLRQAGLR